MRRARCCFVLGIVIVVLCENASAFDAQVSLRIENLAFSPTRTADETDFTGTEMLWGLSLSGSGELMDNITLEAGFASDRVVRNLLYALIHYQEGSLKLGVGPFFGFFNTSGSIFQGGISTRVKIELPGIVFLTIDGDNTIGGKLYDVGDYMQERNEVSLGSFLWGVPISLAVSSKRYTQKSDENTNIIDGLNEYILATTFTQPMTHFFFNLSLSYRIFHKSFDSGSSTTRHAMSAVVIGVSLETGMSDSVILIGGFESTPFLWGQDYMSGYSQLVPLGYFFRLQFGVNLRLDRIFEASG